jgi:hypothetical protein
MIPSVFYTIQLVSQSLAFVKVGLSQNSKYWRCNLNLLFKVLRFLLSSKMLFGANETSAAIRWCLKSVPHKNTYVILVSYRFHLNQHLCFS